MLSTTPQNPERLRELTRRIGLRLSSETDAIAVSMTAAIEHAIGELTDEDMRAALHASVANNVEVIIDLLSHTKDAHDLPPLPDAMHYAVALARRNVSSAALRRAYHVGSDRLLAHVFDQVQEVDCADHEKLPLYHHLAGWLYQYVDEITRTVIAAHEEEVRYSHNQAARSINSMVNRVLNGESVDAAEFERVTKYRLGQVHVGCRVWIDDYGAVADQARLLANLVDQLGRALDVSRAPLTVATGRATAEAWFGRGVRTDAVDTRRVASVVAATRGARVTFGAPGRGVDGFRTTRTQAGQVVPVAQTSTTGEAHVVSYSDDGIPVIARLAEDITTTRRWVREVLGDLAADTEDAARQRETVRVFLDSAENYSDTASRLLLHRNTVKYRLTKAEHELGRRPGDRRLDTQLALATCEVLGDVVLTPTDSTRPVR
ncbi:PucR family transcriptional regulator [Dietzia cinnamea]|uniref:PucR family transcriptional regulator n=1 Tax=Dietzia cinnamea TaxID=321318 RepID=UPI0021A40453|nr:helix-turn-helix domain-containing protein [Dietzia cinnamea]MCT2057211.1 helix-turn-helix domain-containing protein [Dietzia cinnamea]MCT2120123.1 helix-turn-helix domain-containing protein [Dietzia cinnamea]MCT2144035.1 helix-turn-helix domain-containing protein [Dietzia cinnamea]MCT2303298.1 helix-turn-helix domain-containing protein [Dietzia cinnamea]